MQERLNRALATEPGVREKVSFTSSSPLAGQACLSIVCVPRNKWYALKFFIFGPSPV